MARSRRPDRVFVNCRLCGVNIDRRITAEAITKTAINRLREATDEILKLKDMVVSLQTHLGVSMPEVDSKNGPH